MWLLVGASAALVTIALYVTGVPLAFWPFAIFFGTLVVLAVIAMVAVGVSDRRSRRRQWPPS